eukprot:5267932-Amphidinium_carterae.1
MHFHALPEVPQLQSNSCMSLSSLLEIVNGAIKTRRQGSKAVKNPTSTRSVDLTPRTLPPLCLL